MAIVGMPCRNSAAAAVGVGSLNPVGFTGSENMGSDQEGSQLQDDQKASPIKIHQNPSTLVGIHKIEVGHP